MVWRLAMPDTLAQAGYQAMTRPLVSIRRLSAKQGDQEESREPFVPEISACKPLKGPGSP
jgi:hypothetical protein